MPDLEIAIVGAGPAGSAAAWRLARGGCRVTLFDASHPREKPCGGGLTGRALTLVREILGSAALPGVAVSRMRFQSGRPDAPRAAAFAIPECDTPLLVVSRRVLDQALLEAAVAAGARLVAERVVDVSADRSGVSVVTRKGRHAADAVLGADGATSLVRRRLLAPFGRRQFSVATGYYVPRRACAEVVVHSVAAPPGYLWSFPRPDHLAVGICAPAEAAGPVERLRAIVRDWLTAEGQGGEPAWCPYTWPIPSLGCDDLEAQQVAGPCWMLAGDAAGLVDPLTREGLYYALASGLLAASAWLEADAPEADYAARVADEIRPELRRAAALQARFFSSGFSDLLVDALERSAGVRAIMNDLVAGRQPYASLRRRLLGTFEVGLAWRLLQLQLRGMMSTGPAARDVERDVE
jgi:menaquinone-9 beta-reductase